MNSRLEAYLEVLLPAVKTASSAILEIYNREFQVYYKDDQSPVTDADRASSDILMDSISVFGETIISEEGEAADFENRKNKPVWLVDPLDGTKEFIKGNDEFCIAIARVNANGKSEFGMIVDVVNSEVIFGI